LSPPSPPPPTGSPPPFTHPPHLLAPTHPPNRLHTHPLTHLLTCLRPPTNTCAPSSQVQEALHANQTRKLPWRWTDCSSMIRYSRADLLSSMLPVYKELLDASPGGGWGGGEGGRLGAGGLLCFWCEQHRPAVPVSTCNATPPPHTHTPLPLPPPKLPPGALRALS
jgi:hypothetical protein